MLDADELQRLNEPERLQRQDEGDDDIDDTETDTGSLSTPSTDSSAGSLDHGYDSRRARIARKRIEEFIDRLMRLSRHMRRHGAHQRNKRATNYEPSDRLGRSLVEDFSRHVSFMCNQIFEGPFGEGEDIFHVDEFLLERIKSTIMQRWRRICYWNHHASRFALPEPTQSEAPPKATTFREASVIESVTSQISKSMSKAPKQNFIAALSETKQSSAPTTLANDFKLLIKKPSRTSSAGSTRTHIRAGNLSFPPPPIAYHGMEEFECPYCRLLCSTKNLSKTRWQ